MASPNPIGSSQGAKCPSPSALTNLAPRMNFLDGRAAVHVVVAGGVVLAGDDVDGLRLGVDLVQGDGAVAFAEALRVRYPDLDELDAKVWSSTTMALIRLFQRNATAAGLSYADAARGVFDRLGALTQASSVRQGAAGSNRSGNAGY
ncbi:hypothetical protein [Streptomyces coeruleorubidus]|nr:hypothetical protein [Streptomyces coeruleorubidus]